MYVKSKDYVNHSATIQEFKERFERNIREIQSTIVENIFQNFVTHSCQRSSCTVDCR